VLAPRDGAGVVVAPVAGAPSLAEAIASALRDAEIPASTVGEGNKGSYHLFAATSEQPQDGGRSSVIVAWELHAAGGKRIGQGTTDVEAPSDAWRQGDETLARNVANKAAPAIAKLVQDEPPKAVAVAEPLLAVRTVSGAPGDGARALPRAMDFALRRVHVAIAEKPDDRESFVLTGKVQLSPPASGRQQVKVSWALLRAADGSEIGEISQENAVPAGSLDGPWGDIAFAVANAAAPGVAQLLRQAKAAGTGS
jgi:hypothetical protein